METHLQVGMLEPPDQAERRITGRYFGKVN